MNHSTRSRDAAFKATVVLEAVRGDNTIAQIVGECGVHPNQIGRWKKKLLEDLPSLFSDKRAVKVKSQEELESELYRQIGQLKVELEWLKKLADIGTEEKRSLIENNNTEIPITRQCELLGISRSGYYYQPEMISPYNLYLMNLIDEQYTRMPFYGVNRMTAYLTRQGYQVNVKRVRRLMRLMGLEAIYSKRGLSVSSSDHLKYPYFLKDLDVIHPDQVWCADITHTSGWQRGFYNSLP